jgi:hypothetical protein
VHGLRDPAALSEDDLEIFFLFMARLMAVFDTVVEHHTQLGTTDREKLRNHRIFILQFLESPGGQLWFENGHYRFTADTLKILDLAPGRADSD